MKAGHEGDAPATDKEERHDMLHPWLKWMILGALGVAYLSQSIVEDLWGDESATLIRVAGIKSGENGLNYWFSEPTIPHLYNIILAFISFSWEGISGQETTSLGQLVALRFVSSLSLWIIALRGTSWLEKRGHGRRAQFIWLIVYGCNTSILGLAHLLRVWAFSTLLIWWLFEELCLLREGNGRVFKWGLAASLSLLIQPFFAPLIVILHLPLVLDLINNWRRDQVPLLSLLATHLRTIAILLTILSPSTIRAVTFYRAKFSHVVADFYIPEPTIAAVLGQGLILISHAREFHAGTPLLIVVSGAIMVLIMGFGFIRGGWIPSSSAAPAFLWPSIQLIMSLVMVPTLTSRYYSAAIPLMIMCCTIWLDYGLRALVWWDQKYPYATMIALIICLLPAPYACGSNLFSDENPSFVELQKWSHSKGNITLVWSDTVYHEPAAKFYWPDAKYFESIGPNTPPVCTGDVLILHFDNSDHVWYPESAHWSGHRLGGEVMPCELIQR